MQQVENQNEEHVRGDSCRRLRPLDDVQCDNSTSLESNIARYGHYVGRTLYLNQKDPHHAGAGGIVKANKDKFNISRRSDQKSL